MNNEVLEYKDTRHGREIKKDREAYSGMRVRFMKFRETEREIKEVN